ncbi:hypothetical protein CDEST_02441 [Colletotrichum destructivum]|uniref:Uncharacterized protein n=1 Tax=Colletotrichum destructivum TaxID=34406 RepID=A0AAX4I228_9PEZI|nr:hypothetical protein CDEST_02441 [Colletotrichum destructivum]
MLREAAPTYTKNTASDFAMDQGYPIYLYVAIVKKTRRFLTKPVNLIAHWAVYIEGHLYELIRNDEEAVAKGEEPKYGTRHRSYQEWWDLMQEQDRKPQLVDGAVGYTSCEWSPDEIDNIGNTRSKSIYEGDEQNCQSFVRLLVDMIGDSNTRSHPQYPSSFDKLMQSTYRGYLWTSIGLGTAAMGAAFLLPFDGGSTATYVACAANVTLQNARTGAKGRYDKEMAVWVAHQELREKLRLEGVFNS